MSSGLLLDARCEACGYEASNLALGANQAFLLEEEEGWLAVITACPRCRTLVDVSMTRKEIEATRGAPKLVCPHCGRPLPQPAKTYPQLTLQAVASARRTVFEGLRCPRCGELTLMVRVVGSFQ